jgi:hypothetical protein
VWGGGVKHCSITTVASSL